MSGAEILSMRLLPGFRGRVPPFRPLARTGFTGAGCREGQFPLVWRSRRGHEIPVLLALSFNPLAGDRSGLQPAGQPTTPSADFCAAVRPPCDGLSPTAQISWGKPRSFPRSPAGFTAMALEGSRLRDWLPAPYLPQIRFLFVGSRSRFLQTVPRGSALALRSYFTSIRLYGGLSPPSCWTCPAHSLFKRTGVLRTGVLDRHSGS
jgi:hypothetical protein